eukprot:10819952-Prorocentrum_lima.AAC.1
MLKSSRQHQPSSAQRSFLLWLVSYSNTLIQQSSMGGFFLYFKLSIRSDLDVQNVGYGSLSCPPCLADGV